MTQKFTYAQAGVDIAHADQTKEGFAKILETNDARVLNAVGAFASLFDARFPGFEHPLLVLKTEEPGTKQMLAFRHGRVQSICEDTINHLINDIAVMGATPLSVQNAIICGKIEKSVVQTIVASFAAACKAQGCVLTGGETSEQPGMIEPGLYVLTASVVGIVDKPKIIDGSAIRENDTVLALASSGLHTNGYTLVRALMQADPTLEKKDVNGQTFLDAILTPHRCYFADIKDLFGNPHLHGMAHITGGGIEGNLNRVLPADLDAEIDASGLRILPIFNVIRDAGNVEDAEMLKTYNMGVGLTMVVHPDGVDAVRTHLAARGVDCYPIGTIVKGKKKVQYAGALNWAR